MRKSFIITTLAILATLIIGCQPSINPSFSYTPEEPRAGQSISFVNLTNEGEYWGWDFGDGTYSSYKNPSKVYKKPGRYTVTLCVDSNKHYVTSQDITVYDTLPYIHIETDSVVYYEDFTVRALIYNPYNKKVTCDWGFSSHAVSEKIVDGHSAETQLSLHYNHFNTTETITLDVMIGDSAYHVERTVYVHDAKGRALYMTDQDGALWRQRLYENGIETPVKLSESAQKLFPVGVNGDILYLVTSDIQEDPTQVAEDVVGTCQLLGYDLTTQQQYTLLTIQQHPRLHISRASLHGGSIYWSNYDDYLFQLPISTTNANFVWDSANPANSSFFLAGVDYLGYYDKGLAKGQATGGIALYADTYFWAKYGSGAGIYRFTQDDILPAPATANTPVPESGRILDQVAIKHFRMDAIQRKIYYLTPAGNANELWVCNMDGRNATKIAAGCADALWVDNATNRLYFVDAEGIKAIRLLATQSNILTEEAEKMADIQVTGLVLDNQKR